MHGIRETPIGGRFSCAVCGARHGVALKRFPRTYTPPWVYLTLLVGLIPAAIISLVVSTRHELTVPFCAPCSRRHGLISVVNVFTIFGVIAAVMVGIGYAVNMESWAPFGASILLAGVVIAAAARYARNAQPEYLKFDADNVVIRDVVHGPVVLFARYPAYHPTPAMFGN